MGENGKLRCIIDELYLPYESIGGIIGICTSFYLTEHELYKQGKVEIIILESSGIASGSSSVQSALITSQWQNEAVQPLTKISVKLHQRLSSLYDGKNQWGFRSVQPWLMNFIKLNDGVAKLPEEFDYFSSKLGEKDEFMVINAGKFCQKLFEKIHERGVQLVYGKAILVKNNCVHYVPKGKEDTIILDADKVCVSAGAWTGYILPYSGIGSLFAQSLLFDLEGSESKSKEYVAICNVNPQNPEYPERSIEVHFLPDNKMYLTGATLFTPLPKDNEAIRVNPQHLMDLKETLDLLLAEQMTSKLISSKSCFLPTNRLTGIPILTVSCSGIYIAAGHANWGITQGPATGLWMAELILEGKIKSFEI
ncbi:FAD-dependent amino acid oxidase [Schizosaccharomyces cryophilus OY26]|uniref:FAD-dependent amino acid oxidase n=1 Tax=Schizosaccharomyces cryophilus (strain OY26 / ATCC MYA-4695 / CBS 11777 / NBRC 106824 / NRRL Y48691) TaxID=653667 RepID=S9VWZ0_SCHCR|nr:FAD-dependent amino acid oxidase [Schizosaccharomyces cryophilus OY26]EPY52173.1 FAD-dependent amino acid oxidase [Schizosaccharomyces cryophilus OY26]